MRAFIRTGINLGIALVVVILDGWITSQPPYQHASHHGRITMLAGPVLVAFVIACIVLYAVPSKKQLARRKQREQAKRPVTRYAITGRRR